MEMELTLFSMLIFVLPFSVALMFLLVGIKSRFSIGTAKLPPGKMGWPIIGETLEFIKAGRRGVPEEFVTDRMLKYSSDIFKTSILGEPIIVFSGAAENKFLFSNEHKLVRGTWPRFIRKIFPSGIQSIGEETLKFRKITTGFLKIEALKRYIGIMDTVTKQHLKTSWENQKDVMAFNMAKSYTSSIACMLFLSIADPIQSANFARSFTIVASGLISLPIDFPGTTFNKAIKAANHMRKRILEIIKQRKIDMADNKVSPMQDILQHMLLATDDDGQFQSEAEIADRIMGMFFGSHETATAAITFVVKYLAELPHVYDEVYKEQVEILKSKQAGELLNWEDIHKMRYSWNVACEVMRLAPPVQGNFREVIDDFTYAGFSFPRGWKIYWSANATHKNPTYFPDPEKFDPSRFEGDGPAPYTYVPFGGGPRICPGREYARLEILVFIHNLVTKFRWEKIIPDEKIVVDPQIQPAQGLPIRLQPHAC